MPPLRIVHTRSGASATLSDVGDVVSVGRKEMCEICIPGQGKGNRVRLQRKQSALYEAKLSRAHDLLGLSDVQVTSQLWPVEPTCHVISPAARESSAKRRSRIEPPKKINWAGGWL